MLESFKLTSFGQSFPTFVTSKNLKFSRLRWVSCVPMISSTGTTLSTKLAVYWVDMELPSSSFWRCWKWERLFNKVTLRSLLFRLKQKSLKISFYFLFKWVQITRDFAGVNIVFIWSLTHIHIKIMSLSTTQNWQNQKDVLSYFIDSET